MWIILYKNPPIGQSLLFKRPAAALASAPLPPPVETQVDDVVETQVDDGVETQVETQPGEGYIVWS